MLISVIIADSSLSFLPQMLTPFLFFLINWLHLNKLNIGFDYFDCFPVKQSVKTKSLRFLFVYISSLKKISDTKLVVIKVALIKHICFKWVNVKRQLSELYYRQGSVEIADLWYGWQVFLQPSSYTKLCVFVRNSKYVISSKVYTVHHEL